MVLRQNVFTSRAPHNVEEIDTCIAMLEDSPYWDDTHYRLSRADVVKMWEELLTTGRGYIDIVENTSYETLLQRYSKKRKHPYYNHNFHSCFFIYYLTQEFVREIIIRDDIYDINMHVLQALIAHRRQNFLPSPVPNVEQLTLAGNQVPGYGLYCFNFFIWHPELEVTNPRVVTDSAQYGDRSRRSAQQIVGGLAHDALISICASDLFKEGYEGFGQKVLREYPGNENRSPDEKKYVFCLTKDRATSELLDIPKHMQSKIECNFGNGYRFLFDQKKPISVLTRDQQHICYLIALGYSIEQIVHAKFPQTNDSSEINKHIKLVSWHQNQACNVLYQAGYRDVASGHKANGAPKYNRDSLRNFIVNNLYQIRSFITPLYPWPDGLFLPN